MADLLPQPADWIAVDWGPARARAWALADDGTELARSKPARTTGGPAGKAFEPALLALIGPWLSAGRMTPVIICGTESAPQGWPDVPYRMVPCTAVGDRFTAAPVSDPRIAVTLLPGVAQARPADAMRGEETKVAGFLAANPTFDGTLCLPGPHTRWVQVSAGEIVSLRTAMTGALFAALAGHTALRHAIGKSAGDDPGTFLDAVDDAMARPESLTARLFAPRAEALLGTPDPAAASRISGLLIGADLAGARGYWLGTRLALIGTGSLAALYGAALTRQGVAVEQADAGAAVLAGLKAARTAMSAARPA
ncbi:MAG: 2-keto-3-deoxy-galactonokinase [Rhodobacterales bacterium]|nr:MAG: 2-keto-3-deoxy-galactonokinase [Rhodobacterales bacterium]